jgi:crossover junction endodeoxyribonuclease RuvC
MIILGIDPGLVKTGYGLIQTINNNYSILDFGIIKPNSKDKLSQRLFTIQEDVLSIMDKYNPDILSIEEVFFGKNVKSALLLGHARGVPMLCAASKKMPVFEYSPRKIKQSVTGNGNADKSQVQYMIMKQFNLKTFNYPDDASDALAVALCHLNQIKLNEL